MPRSSSHKTKVSVHCMTQYIGNSISEYADETCMLASMLQREMLIACIVPHQNYSSIFITNNLHIEHEFNMDKRQYALIQTTSRSQEV